MAPPIVIYGDAVQTARNRLRSAQISTMMEVLNLKLFKDWQADPTLLDTRVRDAILGLPPVPADNQADSQEVKRRKAAARAALVGARTRANQFFNPDSTKVGDAFAIGDALRYVGEYIENGGAPDSVNTFRAALRNQAAFSRDNRSRREVEGYRKTEWPDLGIFKFRLTDRSVVKYMERFYGPYIGADISGTTTDSLAVLAFLQWLSDVGGNAAPDANTLQTDAATEITAGNLMVPIASMVLQYHHTLLETGIALALPSGAFGNASAISAYSIYDLTSLVNQGSDRINQVLELGSGTLLEDLGNRGLVVLRDFIDIEGASYADCEIGLLVDQPADADLFKLDQTQYDRFANNRRAQGVTDAGDYPKGDPSLISIAISQFSGDNALGLSAEQLRVLARSNAGDLAQAGYFNDLDAALPPAQNLAAQPQAQQRQVAAVVPAATPSAGASSSGITTSQLQDLKKALAIVQLLEGAGARS